MDEILLKRLTYIKYLFSKAQDESRMPEPMCGFSVLSFHDSIELFLQLICEKFDINKSDIGFMDQWERINKKSKDKKLTDKERIRLLNKARVNLKHSGIMPSMSDIEAFRVNSESFLRENCNLFFDINIDEVSMIDLIQYEKTRKLLKEAKQHYDKGDDDNAAKCVAAGFELLISMNSLNKNPNSWTPFGFDSDLSWPNIDDLEFDIDEENTSDNNFKIIDEFIKRVKENISAFKVITKILGLGIDYTKYVRFKTLMPEVYITGDGTYHVDQKYGEILGKNYKMAKSDYNFCKSFVIEVALKLQDMEKYSQ